ncbi:MAG: hypothetical protein O7A71_10240, partial [Chloroflexi bacterium]|nr:hypothetical protein [Chloroflexota bacterium]
KHVALIGCGFQCGGELFGSLSEDIPALLEELESGAAYVVVQTKSFRDGEIRGLVEITSEDDPRVIALANSKDAARSSVVRPRAETEDHGFPAWGWAIIVAGIAAALVASSTARR